MTLFPKIAQHGNGTGPFGRWAADSVGDFSEWYADGASAARTDPWWNAGGP